MPIAQFGRAIVGPRSPLKCKKHSRLDTSMQQRPGTGCIETWASVGRATPVGVVANDCGSAAAPKHTVGNHTKKAIDYRC